MKTPWKTRNVCWVKTLRNSQENACVGVSRPAVLLKKTCFTREMASVDNYVKAL